MRSLWASQWFCIANGGRKLQPREIKSFMEHFLKKCCKNAVKMPFSNVVPTKQVALACNIIWTNQMGWGIYIPNIKTLRHLEVCQYAAKCSKNAIFWTFLSMGPSKMTALTRNFRWIQWSKCIVKQTKYLVPTSSKSQLICCKMYWGFFSLFWPLSNVAPTKMTALP